ncbi:MAG: hypothetical protein U0X71_00910 [Sphingobacteriaceae bacterium]
MNTFHHQANNCTRVASNYVICFLVEKLGDDIYPTPFRRPLMPQA